MNKRTPSTFLNSAQRKIIVDWFVGIEEETALIDGTTTVEEIAEYRKKLEAMPNPDLHAEMLGHYCPQLWQEVAAAF